MPLANSGESYHRRVSEAKLQRACGQDDELCTGLGAAYMRDCFRAQTFDSVYVDEWHLPNATTLPKSQRCRLPLSITPRGTIRVPIFSSRMTLVLCTWLTWVHGTGNMSKALNKVQKISDVLIKEGAREDLQVSKLRGVVLLPNIVSISLENEGIISEAITVTGARARELLGGLPTACLAASGLKPGAGEPNQS